MITRRQFSAITLSIVVSMVLGPFARAASPMHIDLSTVLPDGNFHTQNAKMYSEEVAKATGGEVQIQVHSGGALGFKGPDHLEAVGDGLVGMADIHISQQAGNEPVLAAETVPFLVNDLGELKILHRHLLPLLEEAAAKHNQKILYIVPWPAQYLFSKIQADSLEGLKNSKVRVSDRNVQDMCAAIGITPVLIPWVETIPALASGTISGLTTSTASAVDGRLWEFVKYIYPTNHTWISQMVNINLDTWNKLSPTQQKAMTDVADRLQPVFWDRASQADVDGLEKLKSMGMEAMPISPAMRQEMRDRTSGQLEAFMKRVPSSETALNAYLAEVKR
ncbi:MAG: TRAP transporter substrate-binding protein [Pusillimonas sp.]